jgi:leader peptidase (prepilin peptidase)/N-methyltransferase
MTGWEIWAILFGLVVGSFANVCIHRIPRGQSVVAPRSRCPQCGAAIRPWDNVPVLSFVVLRGRCRACRGRISLRYPLVELANGLLWGSVAVVQPPEPRAFVTMAFLTALLVLSLIDLEHFVLPDVITLPGIALGLGASLLPEARVAPREALASAAGAFALFALVALVYQKLRGVEGLGQGDWKMVAMLGAFLGWQGTLLTVLLACVGGTLVGVTIALWQRAEVRRQRIPLGTFLGLAGMVVVFLGDDLLAWYGRLWIG